MQGNARLLINKLVPVEKSKTHFSKYFRKRINQKYYLNLTFML